MTGEVKYVALAVAHMQPYATCVPLRYDTYTKFFYMVEQPR